MIYKIFAITIIVFFGFLSCGIDELPVLSPPLKLTESDSNGTFSFKILTSNSELEFRGFEVYYKFYSLANDALLLAESNLSYYSDMKDYGFFRLTRYNSDDDADKNNDNSLPLIKVEPLQRGFEAEVVINFSDITNPYITSSTETNGLVLTPGDLGFRRGVVEVDNTGYYKSFTDTLEGDEDLDNITVDEAETGIYISLYVFSFGKKEHTEPIYSQALHLSRIQIQLKEP